MDNTKMGAFIRDTRKKKGLTQKDIASHLNITDRAVSKWERGICAPDLALLEPLSDILGVTLAELISGEYQMKHSNQKELENALKKTIRYSKQEITMKHKKANIKLIIISFTAVIIGVSILLGIMWYKGFFHKIGKYPSPNGTTVTTVYDCRLGYHEPPGSGGFTLSDEGYFQGRTTYENAEFRGLWWSPNGSYQVVSMYIDNEILLAMADFTRNCNVNLTSYLKHTLYNNDFFADVLYEKDWQGDISFEFIQWSNADPEMMLIYFSYTDAANEFHEGYMWYDYESGQSSGEMEIIQCEKETYWLNNVINDLY